MNIVIQLNQEVNLSDRSIMYIITIGGNIGCGKTTLLSQLMKDAPDRVFPEPIDKWGSWLDMFYVNPEKCAFPFQMKVLLEFMYFKDTHDDKVVITERSPLDALYVFGKTLFESKQMTHTEYNLFKEYVDAIGWKPHVYIYLRTDAEVCVQRIQDRSRACETGIDPLYVQKIQTAYNQWMNGTTGLHTTHNTIVHVIDANQDKQSILKDVKALLSQYNFYDK